MNRTDVGRQMVGDLGNFVGQDIHSQFSRKPQKLAEGDIVEGEVSVGDDLGGEGSVTAIDAETGEITYTYEAKTGEGGYEMRPGRSFKYNPEDGYGFPSTSGRRRLIKKGQVSAAGQGSPEYFKTAEAIEVEAAPAAAAAPPQEKPSIPINQETDADEAARQEDRDQLFNPLKHSYSSTDKMIDKYKVSEFGDRAVKWALPGPIGAMLKIDPERAIHEHLGKDNRPRVRDLSSGDPSTYMQNVVDPRERPWGIDKEDIAREIKGVRDLRGVPEDSDEYKKRFDEDELRNIVRSSRHYLHPVHNREDAAGRAKEEEKRLTRIRLDKEEAERDKENTEAEKRLEEAKGPLRATLQQLVGKLGNIGHGAYGRGVNVDYGTGMPSGGGGGGGDGGAPSATTLSNEHAQQLANEEMWNEVKDYWGDDSQSWANIQEAEKIASTLDNDSLSGQMMMNRGGPIPFARGGGLSSMVQPDQHINPGDFVISSDVVSGVGDGSSEFGVQRLSEEFGIPQSGPFQAALGGEVRGPGGGLDDFLQTSVAGKKAALLSNQEMVVPRDIVAKAALKNNPKLSPQQALKQGQNMFYNLMTNVRSQKNQTTGGNQPSKLKGSLASLTNPIKNRG